MTAERVLVLTGDCDARSWEGVVRSVESSVTPKVEVLEPGALVFATLGPSRYFGGDETLAGRVLEAVGTVRSRVGVADGLFAARLAASVAGERPVVVPPASTRAWLAPFPVSVLGEGYEDLADLLYRLGVRTLGDLARLPGASVLGRFGALGAAAHRLARGLGERPLRPRAPPPDLVVDASLDPPEFRVEAATFVTKALADDLLARLASAGLATTKVAIEVESEHGEHLVRHWRHEGELSAQALAERARWQLEGWSPTGGIVLIRLLPEEVRPDLGRQLGFWGGSDPRGDRAARAFSRVQGLLGPGEVVTAVLGGGRGFTDQVNCVAWGDALPDPAESSFPWPGRLSGLLPAAVHEPPRPALLLGDGGEQVTVSARGLLSTPPTAASIDDGPVSNVVAWSGPWPLEERWWRAGGRRRARLQVLLADGEAHLLSRESGSWWVEASYE